MTRGPVPNRSDNLSRARDANRGDSRPILKKGTLRPVKVPRADSSWHPIAKKFYSSLQSSGQSDFYQDSDWAYAWNLAEELSVYKKSSRRSGQMYQTIMSAMSNLLVTEADRRRIRIELDEPEEETDAELIAIDGYRKELGVGG